MAGFKKPGMELGEKEQREKIKEFGIKRIIWKSCLVGHLVRPVDSNWLLQT